MAALAFGLAEENEYKTLSDYIIARFVLGVKPLAPGFAKIEVRPQTGGLKYVRGTVPTAKGQVTVEVKDGSVKVDVPASIAHNARLKFD